MGEHGAHNREWITRPPDVGVWNLHCPQVESADHAREIARQDLLDAVASQEQAKQWKDAGALLLVCLVDVEMLHTGSSRAMAQIRGG